MTALLGVLFLIGFHLDTSTVHASDFSRDDLKVLATGIATAHGLNVSSFLSTIECESHWDSKAVGDHNTSFGIAQLHNPQRDWGITKEQAFEPLRALEIMATAWENHQERKWSCFGK